MVSPGTVALNPVTVTDSPPGDAVTVYDVMVSPPLLLGGVMVMVADAFPATATGAGGALGFRAETTVCDGEDVALPAALVAVTVNVYCVPVTRLGTMIGLVVPLAFNPAGFDVTV